MVAKNMKKVFSLVLSLVFATASSYVAYWLPESILGYFY